MDDELGQRSVSDTEVVPEDHVPEALYLGVLGMRPPSRIVEE